MESRTFLIIMNGFSNHKTQLLSLNLGVKMTYLSFVYLLSKY